MSICQYINHKPSWNWSYLHAPTRWCPPSYKLLYNPINYRYITNKNHSYWSYKPTGAPSIPWFFCGFSPNFNPSRLGVHPRSPSEAAVGQAMFGGHAFDAQVLVLGWGDQNSIWLVVEPTPLKNMTSSVGMMKFPTEWKNILQTTNQV